MRETPARARAFFLPPLLLMTSLSSAAAAKPELPGAQATLRELAAQKPPTRILVLGTPHLAELGEGFRPAALARLHRTLADFAPTKICIETLTPDDIEAMRLRGGTDAAVVDMFAKKTVRLGELLQKHLKVTRLAAAAAADRLLAAPAKTDTARLAAIGHLIASYEYPSAVLQWSYLSPAARADGGALPAEARRQLDASLRAASEVYSVAVPLARAAGLERLIPVDSQWDGARMMRMPEAQVEELFAHPQRRASAKAGPPAAELLGQANTAGDLLPLYLTMASDAYARQDVLSQWGWLFGVKLDSGLDRYRIGQWQARNLRIAANITDAINSTRPERVVVLIGAAHRPFLADHLGALVDVELVRLADLVASDEK